MEIREFRAERVALDDQGVIEGLVTPFDSPTVIGDLRNGGWNERIARGAFAKTLQEGDPLMVNQHNLAQPLARKSAGNLELHEGQYEGRDGLVCKANPVDTSYARDLRALVKAKVIRGMSFGFNVVKDAWFDDDGNPADRSTGTHREVREVKLIEVSPVTRPAYTDTAISARDETHAILEERAAKATYADLETCGDCGATGQYGAHCSNCGSSMASNKPSSKFCPSCGGKMPKPGSRETHECSEEREERGPKPYGDVAYADPKNGKYPIDAKHIKAAWAYINQAKNAAKYPLNGVTLASVKAKIKAAMKKFGHAISGEAKDFNDDFFSPEWREDDPYLDDWYEIDADADDEPTTDESKSQEPDSSTPEVESDQALRMQMRSRQIELELDIN